MSKYVDGFLLVVPKSKREEYIKIANEGRDIWMKHGALSYFECRADDLKPHEMGPDKNRDFNHTAGANNDEEVWFSFITFNSKAHRDEVNAKVMAEMSDTMTDENDMVMPFDMKRMSYGGFQVEVEG